jgi:membrane protease YdiL (CAAX protease family)
VARVGALLRNHPLLTLLLPTLVALAAFRVRADDLVPMYLARGNSLGLSLAIGLFGLLPGLLLGYVFYRTRSIWPGAIWHTSFTGVALLFWPHT